MSGCMRREDRLIYIYKWINLVEKFRVLWTDMSYSSIIDQGLKNSWTDQVLKNYRFTGLRITPLIRPTPTNPLGLAFCPIKTYG
jgi:hypothetical protein